MPLPRIELRFLRPQRSVLTTILQRLVDMCFIFEKISNRLGKMSSFRSNALEIFLKTQTNAKAIRQNYNL